MIQGTGLENNTRGRKLVVPLSLNKNNSITITTKTFANVQNPKTRRSLKENYSELFWLSDKYWKMLQQYFCSNRSTKINDLYNKTYIVPAYGICLSWQILSYCFEQKVDVSITRNLSDIQYLRGRGPLVTSMFLYFCNAPKKSRQAHC
jgi:hypothetical protein